MTPQDKALLHDEVERLRLWFACFDGPPARVGLMPSGETLYVRGMPLGPKFQPNTLDVALVLPGFPAEPAIGMYALLTPENRRLIDKLRMHFNVFNGGAAHGAPPMPGFQWLCVGYLSGWRFNRSNPTAGDSLVKHFLNFYRLLEAA